MRRSSAASLLVVAAILLGGIVLAARRSSRAVSYPSVTPAADSVFTSSRQVTALAIAPDGTVWAGTTGGILRRNPDGKWTKYTRADGLPSHEVRQIRVRSGRVTAVFPTAVATLVDNAWQVQHGAVRAPSTDLPEGAYGSAEWRGKRYTATPDGLHVREGKRWRLIGLPKPSVTWIAGFAPTDEALLVATFEDGIWAFNGGVWKPLEIEKIDWTFGVTAFAVHPVRRSRGQPYTLAFGFNSGEIPIARYDGSKWAAGSFGDEPHGHNVQSLTTYRGDLYVASLDSGISSLGPEGWRHRTTTAISPYLPRQMVEFRNRFYVRSADGVIYSLDGKDWERDVFAKLPRRQVVALAADAHRLYAAQWGGWSEFDGIGWTNFLDLPDLKGIPITCLLPAGNSLWIGTQNRGVAQFNRMTRTLRWHDERSGLTDDWITTLAESGSRIYAGTFVGGLARLEGDSWRSFPETNGRNVTALEPDGTGGIYAATRAGLYHVRGNGAPVYLQPRIPRLDSELQALHKVPGGLWIGARTGLYFLTNKTLADSAATLSRISRFTEAKP